MIRRRTPAVRSALRSGVLKKPDAKLIEAAFTLYKKPGARNGPRGPNSINFRKEHSHPSCEVKFVGVWDTVGALGIPISFLGFLDEEDEFYDTKLGSNVRVARHALAIDEIREDFEPSIWKTRDNLDLKKARKSISLMQQRQGDHP